MGGRNSKSSNIKSKKEKGDDHHHRLKQNLCRRPYETSGRQELVITQQQEDDSKNVSLSNGYVSSEDEFYDGIPRFNGSVLNKNRSRRVTKVSEVTSLLGRVSSVGLERAVDVLDTLGSSMVNLNKNSGFASAVTTKGNELSILAFEVANTIVKGSSLMQTLSRTSIQQLEDVILPSEGVQKLISTDMDNLLKIVAADKREELEVFSGEVVRFGNQCKDPQWHNLDRFFEKKRREHSSQKLLKEEAESTMQQLQILVQYTAELYHELHVLGRFQQDYQLKHLEEGKSNADRKDRSVPILAAELKTQRKLVRNLKKKSLWSRSLEQIMEKLVDIALFLDWEITDAFGIADGDKPEKGPISNRQSLGAAGLALHYANIVLQIDTIVSRPSSVSPISRDTLYQSLPPTIKLALRSKLQSFHVKELTITEIKAEMEKTLAWLVPVASNTAKAHHGFGWVGEWANTRSGANQKTVAPADIIQIETLHHADRQKTEAYIFELVLWLNHLVIQAKASSNAYVVRPSNKSPAKQTNQAPPGTLPNSIPEDQELLQQANYRNQTRGISKSQDFGYAVGTRTKKLDKLNKSSSYSPTRGSNKLKPLMPRSSSLPLPAVDFTLSREKALDIMDRVDSFW